jgi:hypothetical protein
VSVKGVQVLNDWDTELKSVFESNSWFNINSGFKVIGIESWRVGVKVIPVLRDLEKELKRECKGSSGFKAIWIEIAGWKVDLKVMQVLKASGVEK